MAHTHPVVDSDSRFVINSTTRAISTTSDKLELIQGDHQSERITFEIPKIVEGHDMSLSDRIEVHYINIDRRTKATSRDIYIADDMAVDGDKLIFSWLISGNATKYYGRLNFIILFECLDSDGNYTYKWNTEICKLLTIGEGISNTEAVAEDYSDILEKFRKEVIGEATADTVKFTQQELTEEQKTLARKNIQAADAYAGFRPVVCTFAPWFSGEPDMVETFYVKGHFNPVDYKTATEAVATAWGGFHLCIIGTTSKVDVFRKEVKDYIAVLAENGVFGENFYSETDYYSPVEFKVAPYESHYHIKIWSGKINGDHSVVVDSSAYNGYHAQLEYNITKDTFYTNSTYFLPYISPFMYGFDGEPAVNQFKIRKDPSSDMEVATKKYVDSQKFSGSYNDLTDVPTDQVRYTIQNLTDAQKTQTRKNIGAQEKICGEEITSTLVGTGYNGMTIATSGDVSYTIPKVELKGVVYENVLMLEEAGSLLSYQIGDYKISFDMRQGKTDSIIPNDGTTEDEFKFYKDTISVIQIPQKYIPSIEKDVIINSSTEGSTKKFKITVDDAGTITATEVTESTV